MKDEASLRSLVLAHTIGDLQKLKDNGNNERRLALLDLIEAELQKALKHIREMR